MAIELLSYEETAKRMGISKVTVIRYVKRGILPTVQFSSHMVRIPSDRLEALIAAGGCPKEAAVAGV